MTVPLAGTADTEATNAFAKTNNKEMKMPKPNHSTKKKPGRAKWYKRQNVKRELKRRYDKNVMEFLAKIPGTGKR